MSWSLNHSFNLLQTSQVLNCTVYWFIWAGLVQVVPEISARQQGEGVGEARRQSLCCVNTYRYCYKIFNYVISYSNRPHYFHSLQELCWYFIFCLLSNTFSKTILVWKLNENRGVTIIIPVESVQLIKAIIIKSSGQNLLLWPVEFYSVPWRQDCFYLFI